MPGKQQNEPYEITWLIRRLFRAMAQNANERLTGLNITAADRAVLEFLYPDRELAVPEIASRYQVSRQHVQATANRLQQKKLLKMKTNPNHKRSSLLALTSKGKKLFASIRQDDAAVLGQAFAGISRNNMKITKTTLTVLLDRLNEGD